MAILQVRGRLLMENEPMYRLHQSFDYDGVDVVDGNIMRGCSLTEWRTADQIWFKVKDKINTRAGLGTFYFRLGILVKNKKLIKGFNNDPTGENP